MGVWKDRYGNVFVTETTGNKVNWINTLGMSSVIAGNGGTSPLGDGGAPTSASVFAAAQSTAHHKTHLHAKYLAISDTNMVTQCSSNEIGSSGADLSDIAFNSGTKVGTDHLYMGGIL
eukprot:gene36873-45486_t